jgi:16S rRNA (adenine1518-N6/adenine1519-N6)-dimethyltransferase
VTPVFPKRSLGQHFLVDRNLLGVIDRLAGLRQDDVVLEIGPGLGILTTFLADRVRFVHAVELDRGLEAPLREALGERRNVALLWDDALRVEPASLQPTPNALVANLPYNVATPVVAETVVHSAPLHRWCVMVQLEVAERLFASPGTKQYGAVSVAVQLATRRTGLHRVSRHVFRPPPRVESALVAFERRPGAVERLADVKRLADAAFSHRRKTLPNALALAGVVDRESAVAALRSIGHGPATRAEALAPEEYVALEDALRRC